MLFIKDVEWRLTPEYEAGGHLFQIDKGGNQAARGKSPYFLLTLLLKGKIFILISSKAIETLLRFTVPP